MITTDPWAVETPRPEWAEDVLPTENRPLDPQRPIYGCTQHGTFWWQRGCPGCPDPDTYRDLYERLDEWLAFYAARDQEQLDARQEGLL